jgi:hypothetical protein
MATYDGSGSNLSDPTLNWQRWQTGLPNQAVGSASDSKRDYFLDPELRKETTLFFNQLWSRQNARLEAAGLQKRAELREVVTAILKKDELLARPSEFVGFSITPTTSNRYRLLDDATGADTQPKTGSDTQSQIGAGTKKMENPFGLKQSPLEMPNWMVLAVYASEQGFVVTATTSKDPRKHNPNSAHNRGRGDAIDLRTKDHTRQQVNRLLLNFSSLGVTVRDERENPPLQKVWDGPHMHIEVPKKGEAPYLLVSPQFYGPHFTTYDIQKMMGRPRPGTRVRLP